MPTALGTIASHRTVTTTFDPLSIPWHSAWWASDPDWTPPADGGAVSSWRNAGTSGAAATQTTGTSQPTYRAGYANLNGKPALEFDGVNDWVRSTSAAIAQPNHVFIVGWLHPTRGVAFITDGWTSNRHQIRWDADTNIFVYAGGFATMPSGTSRTGPVAAALLINEAATTFRVNGTPYSVTGSVGSQGFSDIGIGAANDGSGSLKGALAFVGVNDAVFTAQEIADLESWAEAFYGVPIT